MACINIKHMEWVGDPKSGPYQLTFGNLITIVFSAFKVPLGKDREITKKDMIDRNTLAECDCLHVANPLLVPGPRVVGPVTQLIADLNAA